MAFQKNLPQRDFLWPYPISRNRLCNTPADLLIGNVSSSVNRVWSAEVCGIRAAAFADLICMRWCRFRRRWWMRFGAIRHWRLAHVCQFMGLVAKFCSWDLESRWAYTRGVPIASVLTLPQAGQTTLVPLSTGNYLVSLSSLCSKPPYKLNALFILLLFQKLGGTRLLWSGCAETDWAREIL